MKTKTFYYIIKRVNGYIRFMKGAPSFTNLLDLHKYAKKHLLTDYKVLEDVHKVDADGRLYTEL